MEKMNKYKRLAMAWEEFPAILKDTQGYGYSYARLDQVIKSTFDILLKNDLYIIQGIESKEKEDYLYTDLIDLQTGEKERVATSRIDTSVELSKMNRYQVAGSAISYFRRYHLLSVLGLAQEDTDANTVIYIENEKYTKKNTKYTNVSKEYKKETSKEIPTEVSEKYLMLLNTCMNRGKAELSNKWKETDDKIRKDINIYYPNWSEDFKKACEDYAIIEANRNKNTAGN